jgi:hypothetical protein
MCAYITFVIYYTVYRAFHNVLNDYKHYDKKTKEPTLTFKNRASYA